MALNREAGMKTAGSGEMKRFTQNNRQLKSDKQKYRNGRIIHLHIWHSPSSLHSSGGFAFLANRGSSHDVVLVLWLHKKMKKTTHGRRSSDQSNTNDLDPSQRAWLANIKVNQLFNRDVWQCWEVYTTNHTESRGGTIQHDQVRHEVPKVLTLM